MILSDRYSEFHACVRIDRQRRQWRRAMQVFSTALPTYAELNSLAERLPACNDWNTIDSGDYTIPEFVSEK